jgi:hypothetical protein
MTHVSTCPYCGAAIPDGDADCQLLYAQFLYKLYSNPDYAAVAFLTVDAHALQHPEIHGYKNNAFHLLRLCWQLEFGGDALYDRGPRWLQVQFDGKVHVPRLEPPTQRGAVTVADAMQAQTVPELAALVQQWGQAVWEAWSPYHDWARQSVVTMQDSYRSKT